VPATNGQPAEDYKELDRRGQRQSSLQLTSQRLREVMTEDTGGRKLLNTAHGEEKKPAVEGKYQPERDVATERTLPERSAAKEGSAAKERSVARESSVARERSRARERSVARALSQAREIIRERSGEQARKISVARALSQAREIIRERSGRWEKGRRMEVIIVEFRRVWRSCEWTSGEGRLLEPGGGGGALSVGLKRGNQVSGGHMSRCKVNKI
jgi:hypothetical protein